MLWNAIWLFELLFISASHPSNHSTATRPTLLIPWQVSREGGGAHQVFHSGFSTSQRLKSH
jgi:hypothetical protein